MPNPSELARLEEEQREEAVAANDHPATYRALREEANALGYLTVSEALGALRRIKEAIDG